MLYYEDDEGNIVEYPVFTAKTHPYANIDIPGCWSSVEVGVYQQNEKDGEKKLLGTYVRNYSTNFDNFAVCQKFGRYFALYSPDYTGTRIMEIVPDVGFKDIGGEEHDGCGFCPTSLYIPQVTGMIFEDHAHPANSKLKDWNDKLAGYPVGSRYVSCGTDITDQKIRYEDGKDVRAYNDPKNPEHYNWVWGPKKELEYGWVIYPPDFGFVSGCVWGDDSSDKIQYLDLTQIEKGIIKREEKFGYVELSDNLSLKRAINTNNCTYVNGLGGRTIGIAIQLQFDLDTGNCYVQDKDLFDRIIAGKKATENFTARQNWQNQWKVNDEEMKKRWVERHAEFDQYIIR